MSAESGASMEVSRELLRSLREACGSELAAVLLHGSRLVSASPDRHSAYDLVVVVNGYRAFYGELRRSGRGGRSATLMTWLNRVLPPNAVSFWPNPPDGPLAKCLVMSVTDFERALGPRRRDHFCLGRLIQRYDLLYARDPSTSAWVEGALAGARETALEWTVPFINGGFTVDGFCQRMLEVSYAGEIRPESGNRARAVFEAQRDFLREAYGPILDAGAKSGRLLSENGGYRATTPPSALERLRWRAYFWRSKLRATTRWLKHTLTFDEWLNYIVRKVKRRTGMVVEIAPWERRLPLLLLWPKVFRVLSSRKKDEGNEESSSAGGDARAVETKESGPGIGPELPSETEEPSATP